jgi:hypothetical protein
MPMKLKIRKIEATPMEVIKRIEELIIVFESIPNHSRFGFRIQTLCSNLGIKELEFWELKLHNEKLFKEKFKVRTPENHDGSTIERIDSDYITSDDQEPDEDQ